MDTEGMELRESRGGGYCPPTGGSVAGKYPIGFGFRRGINWLVVGLLYTSFYLCRYNFSLVNKNVSDEFGFSRKEVGYIISAWLLAYAFGQIINGLLTDRLGGKRAMLIGAAGTVVLNVCFGFGSYVGILGLFVIIRALDGYMQAFGAPGMVKINTAWFPRRERGAFAGVFGFMINLGRIVIYRLGPILLAGFTIFELVNVPPLHWRWLFWVPAGICATVAVLMALVVKQTPEEAKYPGIIPVDERDLTSERVSFKELIIKIAGNPTVWVIALAYACTGAVRQAVDQWFPRFLEERYGIGRTAPEFEMIGFLIPFVASAGSLLAGIVSDTVCKGRRAPVAMVLYFLETLIIVATAHAPSVKGALVGLILISFTANSTHSILGTAAAMDIGGKRMAGFAAGIIDSFQYFGGMLAGVLLGALLDKSLGNYFWFMAPFGLFGGLLMAGLCALKKL